MSCYPPTTCGLFWPQVNFYKIFSPLFCILFAVSLSLFCAYSTDIIEEEPFSKVNREDFDAQDDQNTVESPDLVLGDVCQLNRPPLPVPGQISEFFMCEKPPHKPTSWPWKDKGVWVKIRCPRNTIYHPKTSSCAPLLMAFPRPAKRQNLKDPCNFSPSPSFCVNGNGVAGNNAAMQIENDRFVVNKPTTYVKGEIVKDGHCQCPRGALICTCHRINENGAGQSDQSSTNQANFLASQNNCQCPKSLSSICHCPAPEYSHMEQQQQACNAWQQPITFECLCQVHGVKQSDCLLAPMPCPLAQDGAKVKENEICSWMLAHLEPDTTSNKYYLQCHPAPNNAYCGRWMRLKCPAVTSFDRESQVCSHDPYSLPGFVENKQSNDILCICQDAGTNIGPCNQNMRCPGRSTCEIPQQSSTTMQCQPMCCHHSSMK